MKKNLAIFSLVLLMPFFACFSDEKKDDSPTATSHTTAENEAVLSVNNEVNEAVSDAVERALATTKLQKLVMKKYGYSVKGQAFNKTRSSKAPFSGDYTFNNTVNGGVSGSVLITGSGDWTEDFTEGIPYDPADAEIGVVYTDSISVTDDLNISLTFNDFTNASEFGSGNVRLDGGPLTQVSSDSWSETDTVEIVSFTDGANFSYNNTMSYTETWVITLNGTITFYNDENPTGIVVKYTNFKTTFKVVADGSGVRTVVGGVYPDLPGTSRETITADGSIEIGDTVVEYINEVVYDETFPLDKK